MYHGGVTGSLKLERAPLQKAVYFRDGQILFAASNDPKDQLASILVEEGKLGPDQMQVAQARVSSGNPLTKVLTELGYISQRELAEAARVKVERILTDLYTWNEGTFEFATKSLPKGAIDLDLSTPHLITASIRRIQDRDWVLKELGSLETALTPSEVLDTFINETKADAQTIEVLRQADGMKTVQQIASLSSLGEFEVCKILAAAVVVGAMTKGASVTASEDSFSFPTEEPEAAPASHPVSPSSASLEPPALGGVETVGLPTPPPEQTKNDIFEAPDDTVLRFEPLPSSSLPCAARSWRQKSFCFSRMADRLPSKDIGKRVIRSTRKTEARSVSLNTFSRGSTIARARRLKQTPPTRRRRPHRVL